MGKKLHLISNAHIDPVWQWEWEEGAAEAISTYRTAAQLSGQFDGYIFCHNEAQLYMWVAEYEPKLFEKIKEKVKQCKWHIMGGWFNQPDCNMPSGEAFVRQALFGRKYFKENFNVVPTTVINFDSFGHTRGLVQIIKKAGYDSYMCFRPDDPVNCKLPGEAFTWVGYDGSRVTGRRVLSWYGSNLGRAVEKLTWVLKDAVEEGPDVCLWGVGNHGGGPSRKDLQDIEQFIKDKKAEGHTIFHSTPEAYFDELRKQVDLPEHAGDLNPRFPGCYTSHIRIKQLYRRLENALFMAEKISCHAHIFGMEYPLAELREATIEMLHAQFHDTLPGTSVQPVEETALRGLSHGLEILSRVRARAFFKLAENLPHPKEDEIPIIVYNPHPYAVDSIYTCELSMWDASYEQVYFKPTVYQNGTPLPTQTEKEEMNIPIEWRKRVIFKAELKPMSINYLTCKIEKLPTKPPVELIEKNGLFVFKNDRIEVTISAKTGLVEMFAVDGKAILSKGAFEIAVLKDTVDPWSMNQLAWYEFEGAFTLLSAEKGTWFSGVKSTIPSVRVIEDGDVRTVVEAVFGYNHSFAVLRYMLPKTGTAFDVHVRIQNAEKTRMFKLMLPAAFAVQVCEGEVAFGRENLPCTGRENVSQRYLVCAGDDLGFSVANDGIYGSSCKDNQLMLTLMRSTAYTAHPIEGREMMPQDRFSPYAEQGERQYTFRIAGGLASDVKKDVYFNASQLNQPPYVLSFFPNGDGRSAHPLIEIEELPKGTIEMTAFKKAEKGDGYTMRLFNHTSETVKCNVVSHVFGFTQDVVLAGFEAATFTVSHEKLVAAHMMEGLI